jgi:hypothetical protein
LILFIVGDNKTTFCAIDAAVDKILDKISHVLLLNGKNYNIPHLNLFAFRSTNEPNLQALFHEIQFTFCEDHITKLTALSLQIESKIAIPVEIIFRTFVEKI